MLLSLDILPLINPSFLKVHVIEDKDINLKIEVYFTLQNLTRDYNSYQVKEAGCSQSEL